MSQPTPQRRIGPFVLAEEIGVGGMGVVYRATYEKDGSEMAVKVLAPDLVADPKVEKRFIRETDILKKLRHPNIIRLFGAGSSKTQRFYAMELIEGGTLDTVLREQGKLTWEQAIDYAMQIAKALEHAHNAGIVHRDLKPGNLLIDQDGVLKLSDFGIARDTQATALTQAGKTVGTMNYMAPEQITGKDPVTGRTDLYALGCVLFQMLTGRPPFQAENQAELLFKHLDDVPPSVHDFNPDVPIWLGNLINDLLAKDPADRPHDALAVQVILDDVKERVKKKQAQQAATAGGEMTVAGATVLANKQKKKRKKTTGPATPFFEQTWFLVSALVLLLVGAFVYFRYTVSEGRLYARVSRGMASATPGDWAVVESDLRRLVDWYPEGPHIEEAKLWQDQIVMHREKQRIHTSVRFGREPRNEAERSYREAFKYEEFGDRITALEYYDALYELWTPDPTATYTEKELKRYEAARPTALLAKSKAETIRAILGEATDRVTFIRERIDSAEAQIAEGSTLEAKSTLESVVTLYGRLEEFKPLVRRARELLEEL
ncbi:MAG: serine/threonine protein kinase [Planctomycetaceae bacterium]|nr:serine/threonine protein kinase [Planctomycetaceae bacterium]